MTATACGKVILLGEHAVVHGVPALAVGIDRGARAWTTPTDGPSRLVVREWKADHAVTDDVPLARALRDLLAITPAYANGKKNVIVEAEADLPPGGGLGCSAAIGVAVARALDPEETPDVIADRANVWEKVFHGNPSGIDAAVASLGGCVLFQRGEPIRRVRVPSVFHLCVGNTGIASSTKTMVESVQKLADRRPGIAAKAFEGIHTLVKNARLAIEAGDAKAVGQLLDLNQMLLSGLFVSTPEIEQMCAAARDAGAFGAKLTGAGGGGSVVALVEENKAEAVLAAWKRDGFTGFATTFGTAIPARTTPSIEVSP